MYSLGIDIGGTKCALPAISLVDEAALMTAFLNDCSPDLVFAQQVYGLMEKNDTLVCLSTSGNSIKVVNAAYTAIAKGGKLSEISDVTIKLPSDETF